MVCVHARRFTQKIFGFWFGFGKKIFWVLSMGFGFGYKILWILGLGTKIFGFWVWA